MQRSYAGISRATITKERLDSFAECEKDKEIDYDNGAIREPLLEHVGHLPMIASYLYPKINSTEEIDLGNVLKMLSVHDIGEIKVGDVVPHDKTVEHKQKEERAAKNLLGKSFFQLGRSIQLILP
ncbi:MAG: HD domain-containing protein [Candidatus Magasanikbacteria bacterium]